MPRKDGRVERGQKLSTAISARAWNRAQDAADIVLGERLSIESRSSQANLKPYTWAYCKPSVTVSRWDVLAITGVVITPTSSDSDDATKSFQDTPVLSGETPSSSSTAWCVAVEPIESGKVGRVAVSGVVQLKAGNLKKIPSASVLWKNSDWCLIWLGADLLRLGTINAAWNKGANATVTQINGDGTAMDGNPTFTAKNWFANVPVASGTKKVACGKVGDTWILIAAECS